MTPAPLTIAPETSPVPAASRLMQEQRLRHLPVCEDGRLVGLVSERDLLRVLPSPATSLAAHEVHYLLERLMAEIMTRFPVTVGPDHTMTEASSRSAHAQGGALQPRIGGLYRHTHSGRISSTPSYARRRHSRWPA